MTHSHQEVWEPELRSMSGNFMGDVVRGREGRRDQTTTRKSGDNVNKQRTHASSQWPLTGMSEVFIKNDYEGPRIKLEGARDVSNMRGREHHGLSGWA